MSNSDFEVDPEPIISDLKSYAGTTHKFLVRWVAENRGNPKYSLPGHTAIWLVPLSIEVSQLKIHKGVSEYAHIINACWYLVNFGVFEAYEYYPPGSISPRVGIDIAEKYQ